MKNLFISILVNLFVIGCSFSSHAQSPIKVTVPPFGETVTLQPLKTGCYGISFVVDDQGNQMDAAGVLYVNMTDSGALWIALSVTTFNPYHVTDIWSAIPTEGWIVADNNRFVTIDHDLENGSTKADIGLATVWAYSKKYQALKILGNDNSAIVVYNPKSYSKMSEEKITEAIAKIMEKSNSINL